MVAGLLVGLPLLVTPMARADFQPVFASNPTPTTFIYNGQFNTSNSTDNGMSVQELNPYTGAIPPGTTSTGADNEGSFFTIYDIPNLQSATVNLPGFTAFTRTVGTTPPGITPIPADSPTLTNVTVIYTGVGVAPPVIVTTPTGFPGLLTITLTSAAGITFNANVKNGAFSDQVGTGPGDPPAGRVIAGRGPLQVPALGAVPEPASVVMMSFGGLGVGALSLFFRRKASA